MELFLAVTAAASFHKKRLAEERRNKHHWQTIRRASAPSHGWGAGGWRHRRWNIRRQSRNGRLVAAIQRE